MIWFWKINSSPINQKNKKKILTTSGCTTSRSIFPLEIVKKTKEIQIKPSLTSSWKAELDDLSLLERIRLTVAAEARPCITPTNNQHRKDWCERKKNWKAKRCIKGNEGLKKRAGYVWWQCLYMRGCCFWLNLAVQLLF